MDIEQTGLYELYHYGVKRRSGRYPWGSGEDPYQHEAWFVAQVNDMRSQGMSDPQIAEALGYKNSTALRAAESNSKAKIRASKVAMAYRLKEKGYSTTAIAERFGTNESTVRSWLDPARKERAEKVFETRDGLKKAIDETGGYIDIGAGSEIHLGISKTKLQNAVAQLQDEGYEIRYLYVEQLGSPGNKTAVKVLCPPGTTYKEAYANIDKVFIPGGVQDIDTGASVLGLKPPVSISSKRIQVAYAEDGGIEKDGVIELRRGVEDLNLGNSKYAQVRIAVDGTHYLKGMAVYADDLPDGVDIRFNTNKHRGTPMINLEDKDHQVLKTMKADSDHPFGATIRKQLEYTGSDGKKHLSALNIVNDEGTWDSWSHTLASQFLSKQEPQLAKKQLDLAESYRKAELEDIMSLTNPTVKRKLLESFADEADSAAVHLQAAALPRQRWHVILPITSLSEKEIYAPNYEDGEEVVLVRYPHGGIFEIPRLRVNNKNPDATRVIGKNAPDAVGINAKVAERLSGADFDGDTVLVIPTKGQRIKSSSPLEGLKDFDPKEAYPYHEGMTVMTSKKKQTEMGKVSNLITDMTIKGASEDELARAVRHSMVVIDSEKHRLDYEQSYKDNGIAELKRRWQGSAQAGASTVISRASGEKHVSKRKDKGYDPVTGEKVYEVTPEFYVNKKGQTVERTIKSTQMAETRDAYSLSSGTIVEGHYAEYANHMKELARTARKEAGATKDIVYSPQARKTYAPEVASLNDKLKKAKSNAPLERRAQIAANIVVKAKLADNPDMTNDEIKRVKGQALESARDRTGAKKNRINISDEEWAAIQAGAISKTKLGEILNNADQDRVRELATPRQSKGLSTAQIARAKGMATRGCTQAEIAQALGVSTSTVLKALRS